MKHISEEQLIEHHYGEGRAEVKHHLEVCGECAEAYAALGNDLAALKNTEPPARAAQYGEQVWRSLSSLLPVHSTQGRVWQRANLWKRIGYAAACALLIAGAFLAGRRWEQRKPPLAGNGTQVKQQVVLVVLGDHLDRSERLLIELKHADAGSADMVSPLQEEARNLLPANRRCRQRAIQIDDRALATVLDRLDRVLAELANGPGG
jgi:anti-sigma-K factor RskA